MTVPSGTQARPWLLVSRTAAALAAAMGVGRFAFTPILPLMTTEAGLTSGHGAALATANYAGYLAGALAAIAAPRLIRSRTVLRAALVVLIATLACMPLSHDVVFWGTLRAVAGAASALVFMIAVAALFTHLGTRAPHLTGWGFGGVGAGIAISGVVVLAIGQFSTWQAAWAATAALAAVLTILAWNLAPDNGPAATVRLATGQAGPTRRRFTALAVSYTIEGVGYIIAGTFLVAAIDETAPRSAGALAWIIVGLSAAPSAAIWASLSARFNRSDLLLTALLIQAAAVALPTLWSGIGPALLAAALFGATFIGISTLSLAIGNQLHVPRAVATLTTGYSFGQILGPLVVTPLLSGGYRTALLLGACILLAAAATAAATRARRPQTVAA